MINAICAFAVVDERMRDAVEVGVIDVSDLGVFARLESCGGAGKPLGAMVARSCVPVTEKHDQQRDVSAGAAGHSVEVVAEGLATGTANEDRTGGDGGEVVHDLNNWRKRAAHELEKPAAAFESPDKKRKPAGVDLTDANRLDSEAPEGGEDEQASRNVSALPKERTTLGIGQYEDLVWGLPEDDLVGIRHFEGMRILSRLIE